MTRRRADNLDLVVKRKRLRLGQTEIARVLGVSQTAISNFERLNAPLPDNKSREDYINALDRLAGAGAGK